MNLVFAVLLALVACACANVVKEDAQKPEKLYRLKKISPAESKKALAYWTPERVKAAVARPMPEISQVEAKRQGIDVNAAMKLASSKLHPLRAVIPHENNTEFPYNVMGKVLSTYNDPTEGPGATCSGQYVYNNSFAIVLSAGHCTYNCSAGWFFDNFAFYQEYENGKYQLKAIQNVGVLIALCDANSNYDYANDFTFIQADAIVGKSPTIGIDFHENYKQFVSYGYPINYGKGQILESYSGGKGIIQAGKVQMPNNPMDAGSDGGAWLAVGNKAIGVNAYRVAGVPGVWSPEFNNATVSLLEYVISQGQ